MDKQTVTILLHRIIKGYNDFYGEPTADYNEADYNGIFNCKSPKESHENWCRARKEVGWVYGEIKDIENKIHPCLVEYDKLPERQKIKDIIAQTLIEYYKEQKSNNNEISNKEI